VAELVAHEIEVPVSAGGERDQPDQLVQRQTAIDAQVLVRDPHVRVHVAADQAEDDGLVAHQGLVVGLGVADGLFVPAAVGEFVPQAAHGPVLVRHLLDELDPVIRHPHGEAAVETAAAVLCRRGKPRHAAHILGHGEGIRPHGVNQAVGEREIGERILVHVRVEIIIV